MTVKEMRQLQIIYQQLGSIADSIVSTNNNDACGFEQLRNAQEYVMDAVMANIERAFNEGKLFIDNYDYMEDVKHGSDK